MRKQIQGLSVLLVAFMCAVTSSSYAATTLDDIYQVAEQMNVAAKRSQSKIDALTEETRLLLNEYKTVLKEIEGLRVYNRQLEKQIASQEELKWVEW